MAVILDGKRIADEILSDAQSRVEQCVRHGVRPKLAVILVGDHPASASYVRSKARAAERVGIATELVRLPETVSQATLLAEVDRLNAAPDVDGILVQLPLPSHISEHDVIERVDPAKDVDGFHPFNVGLQAAGRARVWPCTPLGILEMLRRSNLPVHGKHAVIVGRSQIVGRPMARLLLQEHATVTVCHSYTKDLRAYTASADLLVVAAGRPGLVRGDMVQPGAVVIDVGIHRVDGRIVGDVDFPSVEPVAGAITPVPGGVGPLTVAALMLNTVALCEQRRRPEGVSS